MQAKVFIQHREIRIGAHRDASLAVQPEPRGDVRRHDGPGLGQRQVAGEVPDLAAAANHRDYLGPWGSGKEIVGCNNLGEVTFTWQAGDAKKVIQTLWWRLEGMNDAAPLTHYVIDLALGPSLYDAQPVPAQSEPQQPMRKTS